MRHRRRKASHRAQAATARAERLQALLDERTATCHKLLSNAVELRVERDAVQARLSAAVECLTSLLTGPTAGDLEILFQQIESYRRREGLGPSAGLGECRRAWADYSEVRRRARALLRVVAPPASTAAGKATENP